MGWRPKMFAHVVTSVDKADRTRARAGARGCTVWGMDAIAVMREGEGHEVLLVHGGASPRTTCAALAPLGARWTLALV